MYKPGLEFQPRYRVSGTLRTLSPLHVGSGESSLLRGVSKTSPSGVSAPVEVNTVCTSKPGNPYIPGSTIKGAISAWLIRRGLRPGPAANSVFGQVDADNNPVRGGKAEFRDAPLTRATSPLPHPSQNSSGVRRHWDPARSTCVEPRTSIDPRFGTADDQRLYHLEYVPEGADFHVSVELPMASRSELHLLLRALESFNDPEEPVRLGAEQAICWGRVQWKLDSVEIIDKEDVARWLLNTEIPPDLPFRSLPLTGLVGQALAEFKASDPSSVFEIGVTLRFAGPLLVNDPSQQRKDNRNPENSIGHAAILRHNGTWYLPGSSVRGAFRAQAARIWRTLAASFTDLPLAEGDLHSPFFDLFGRASFRSLLDIPDFSVEGHPHRQEFVAIDRFTGGSADEKKFNANAVINAVARGSIRLDTKRGPAREFPGWALLILLYTVRDLIDGDIHFGFGRSKGYGHCSAEISVSPNVHFAFSEALDALRGGPPPTAPALDLLNSWHSELLAQVRVAQLPDHIPPQVRGN